jgi:hypothetical protein
MKLEAGQALWVQIKELLVSCFMYDMKLMNFKQSILFFICVCQNIKMEVANTFLQGFVKKKKQTVLYD